MRLDFSEERVLAVVAHPDDCELLCAGTLARAKADGAAIAVCVLCAGDKGQPAEGIADLAALRATEAARAAALLGAELRPGQTPDGELADTPAARTALVEVYRQFNPTLVLAHWRDDYHADHRATAALAEAASWFACSAGHKTASASLAAPPALWWMDTLNMQGFVPTFYVDVTAHLELKRRMLACHESQLRRAADTGFASLEDLMIAQCSTRGQQADVAAAEAFRQHDAWKRVHAW